jgi:TraY domain
MARRGRPPKGEYPEKKRVFASRIREDTWEMLQRAAAKSGRSLSQEFEFRLRRSLDDDEKIESAFGDLKTFGLMKLAAQAVKSMCDLNNLKVHWTANVTAFDEALEVITRTLQGFRPHVLTATNLVTGPPELGKPLIETVREIQAADPTRPLGKVSKRERAMLRLQSELGDLVDRPSRLLEAKHRKPKGSGRIR